MKNQVTLKQSNRFRRYTRKNSKYGGMNRNKPTSFQLRRNAPEYIPRGLAALEPPPVQAIPPEMQQYMEYMSNIMNAVAIDCEMVGVGHSSVLAHVAIVDFFGNQIYNKYVIPRSGVNSITDYRTIFSGITRELLTNPLNNAEPYEVVKAEVHAILRDKIIVGHGLASDFNALEYHPQPGKVWDTATIDKYMKNNPANEDLPIGTRRRQAKKLKLLAKQIANNNIQLNNGHGHSPLEDARAAMNLYHIEYGFDKVLYRNMSIA